jgi:creatinine amidohydrolase
MTSPEVSAAGARILLVPVGSLEQHGPHLPLDTDTRIAAALAGALAEARTDVLLAPAIAIGSSGEHEGFAGTLSIGTDVLNLVLVELVRSNRDFAHVVFVNGHGGNLDAMQRATAQLVAEGHSVFTFSPSVLGGDAHAGRTETSLMLHLDPSVVRLDLAAVGATEPLGELLPLMRTGGVRAVSPNGVLGDPTGASAEEGAELFAMLVADLASRLAGAVEQ